MSASPTPVDDIDESTREECEARLLIIDFRAGRSLEMRPGPIEPEDDRSVSCYDKWAPATIASPCDSGSAASNSTGDPEIVLLLYDFYCHVLRSNISLEA